MTLFGMFETIDGADAYSYNESINSDLYNWKEYELRRPMKNAFDLYEISLDLSDAVI